MIKDSGVRRIGPKMLATYEYVRLHRGCSQYEVSKAVGPHGSNFYGWRTVQRALAANMITAVKVGGRYRLYPLGEPK